MPYTRKPDDVIPGVANYYASTYQEGLVPYGVLVKAREGRPIHIDGNDEHPVFQGKTSIRAQAEILGLYDPERLRGPRFAGKAVHLGAPPMPASYPCSRRPRTEGSPCCCSRRP